MIQENTIKQTPFDMRLGYLASNGEDYEIDLATLIHDRLMTSRAIAISVLGDADRSHVMTIFEQMQATVPH